jgi:hypothetical protein
MKLAVSYDEHGNITTLFDPEKLKHEKGHLTYVPAPDEKHSHMEVPKELEGKPLMELPALLRVNARGAHPKLEHRG